MVRAAGFDYAELQVATVIPEATAEEWSKVRDRLLHHDVPIMGFNVLLPGHLTVVGPDIRWERLEEYLEVAFARMSELGGRYLSFGSGGSRMVPKDFDRQQAEEQLRAFVSLLGRKGLEYGITVNVEFLNRKETNIILSLFEAEAYVRATALPSVKLLADLYHMMEESEPLSNLRAIATHLGYVHVADTGRRYPGSGQYPYTEFVVTLREVGYDGPVSVECNWGDDIRSEMNSAATYLRRVFI